MIKVRSKQCSFWNIAFKAFAICDNSKNNDVPTFLNFTSVSVDTSFHPPASLSCSDACHFLAVYSTVSKLSSNTIVLITDTDSISVHVPLEALLPRAPRGGASSPARSRSHAQSQRRDAVVSWNPTPQSRQALRTCGRMPRWQSRRALRTR